MYVVKKTNEYGIQQASKKYNGFNHSQAQSGRQMSKGCQPSRQYEPLR